jgi:hypothetical protein
VTSSPPPAPATAASSAALDITSPRPFDDPDAGFSGEQLDEHVPWMLARLASARAGKPDLVRVPLHQHGLGWGCTCPFFYLSDEESIGAAVFVEPHFEARANSPGLAQTVVAEGYFTGASHEEKGDGPTKYRVFDLRVVRTRPFANENDRAVTVLARGDQAGIEAPAPADGRVFLVIDESIALASPRAFETARARAEKLRDRFPEVEVIDSRTVPGLFCCNYVVVIGRRTTEAEAAQLVATAKKAGEKPLVRQGW